MKNYACDRKDVRKRPINIVYTSKIPAENRPVLDLNLFRAKFKKVVNYISGFKRKWQVSILLKWRIFCNYLKGAKNSAFK